MAQYSQPELIEVGNVSEITKGRFFTRPDGRSGGTGNRGEGPS